MATTKEELLKYFGSLDVATLEKLRKYSELLIIPDEDLLVNVTMSQMVDKAHSLADSLFPEWTDRSKSDFGEFLVELFALFSEKDFWYINAFANEGLLRKMCSYSNAFSKASSMGYYPTTCLSSRANFIVTFAPGDTMKYERGDITVDVDGVKFTNGKAFTVPQSADETKINLTLREGQYSAEDIVYNGYGILIRKPNIDLDSVTIIIDNILFTRVRNFGFSSADSKHFMLLPEEDGSCSVYFGSGGFGYQPPIGKVIRVEYRICNGSDGNIASLKGASISESLSDRKATAAEMTSPAIRGVYAESLTSIKERAPLYFNTKRAAINEVSAQEILNSFSFVMKSKVIVVGKEVTYRIIPTADRKEPTQSELSILEEDFHPYLMAGYTGNYIPNVYKDLITTANSGASKIILDVIVLSGYDRGVIETSLKQVLEDMTNPRVEAEYGGAFLKTSADIEMRSKVQGVQSVTFKLLVGTQEIIMPDVTLEPAWIFQKIDTNSIIVRTNVV